MIISPGLCFSSSTASITYDLVFNMLLSISCLIGFTNVVVDFSFVQLFINVFHMDSLFVCKRFEDMHYIENVVTIKNYKSSYFMILKYVCV